MQSHRLRLHRIPDDQGVESNEMTTANINKKDWNAATPTDS
jgi:hypothetical protein